MNLAKLAITRPYAISVAFLIAILIGAFALTRLPIDLMPDITYPTLSVSADYPGVGPEHSWLKDTGRVSYVPATDREALDAFQLLTKVEGIIPALESAHALAYVTKLAPTMAKDRIIVVNLSGRGDKDVFTVANHLGMEI